MDNFLQLLQNTIEKNQLIGAGEQVLVALSGGADSVSLLCGLKRLSFSVSAAHLHHGLRGEEADGDETFICKLCQDLEVPLYVRRVDIRSIAKETGMGLEEAGRKERYAFFKELSESYGFQKIATAHNADDQAETVLMHFLRGAGISGLGGIPLVNGPIIRPMLEISRSVIEEFLRNEGIPHREDSTNLDQDFTRNRIRHNLLPALETEYNPAIRRILNENSKLYTACAEFCSQETDRFWEGIKQTEPEGFSVELVALLKAHHFLAKSALRRGLKELCPEHELTQSVVNAVFTLSQKGQGRVSICQGVEAEACHRTLYLRRTEKPPVYSYLIKVGSSQHLPECGKTISAFLVTNRPEKVSKNEAYFDYDKLLGKKLYIRNRHPGDRFYPVGMNGSKKLQDFLVDEKIPRFLRDSVPVITAEEELLWVAGHRADRRYIAGQDTKNILCITLT